MKRASARRTECNKEAASQTTTKSGDRARNKGWDPGEVNFATEEHPISMEPADVVQIRTNVNNMVWNSAETIATAMINAAKSGQLATAKYLFEVAGIYPATEETKGKPKEDSLAYTLLKRLGLPTEPLTYDGDSAGNGDTVE
jgi:hypothetical protein